jgi:putative hydrolase
MNLLIDMHVHTISSGHAYSTTTEYVEQAKKIGLTHFAITDHAPKMPGTCGDLYFYTLDIIPKVMDGIRVYKGIELNITDYEGGIDFPDKDLDLFDVVIASLHPPCIRMGSIAQNTQAIMNIMKNPKIKIIGHPGSPTFPLDIEAVAKYAKETNTFLEINNKSLVPGSIRDDRESVKKIAQACKDIDHPVIAGSDAHFHESLATFNHCIKLFEEIDLPPSLVLNTDIDKFEKMIVPKHRR